MSEHNGTQLKPQRSTTISSVREAKEKKMRITNKTQGKFRMTSKVKVCRYIVTKVMSEVIIMATLV